MGLLDGLGLPITLSPDMILERIGLIGLGSSQF